MQILILKELISNERIQISFLQKMLCREYDRGELRGMTSFVFRNSHSSTVVSCQETAVVHLRIDVHCT